ncbi:MAG: bifunctional metallophosphatase/5'-nucleotidase [Solirubrobacteraceae bacterium]|nr:bifunctional metallophosphatase/5'-nucleotidase [Solirubrobacteraceae bacterium]
MAALAVITSVLLLALLAVGPPADASDRDRSGATASGAAKATSPHGSPKATGRSAGGRSAARGRSARTTTRKPVVRRTTRTTTSRKSLKRPRSINRRCGRSRSGKRITRRTSRLDKARTTLTVTTRYCDRRVRVVTTKLVVRDVPGPSVPGPTVTVPGAPVPVPGPTVTVPGPPVTVPGPTVTVPGDAPRKSFRLTLLHNNDGESKYKPGDSVASYGSVSRFSTVLRRLRTEAATDETADELAGKESKGTVTVSSGDNFLAGLNLGASFQRWDTNQGSWYDSLALDLLGYDAATLGNHEFDFGPSRLAQFVDGTARTQFVSANTDMSAEPALQALRDAGKIADSTVVVKGGERIGIIGISAPETASISSPGDVAFDADVAGVVNAEAQRLTDAGVNKIILSSHLQGMQHELDLVPQLRNVDVVIAGGGDELLADEDDLLLPGSTPAAGYPLIVEDGDGNDVPVVTTAGEYNYVGRLTATFDADGDLVSVDDAKSGPVRVSGADADADKADPDPALHRQIVQPLIEFSAVADATILGTSEVDLDGRNPDPIRLRESNLGNLVADGFVHAVDAATDAGVIPDNGLATVGLVNGGGIRNNSVLAPGAISLGDTFRILPFNNVISRVPAITPAHLKELLEWGVSALPAANGRFAHVAGIEVTYDAGRAAQVNTVDGVITTPGERIRSVELLDGTKLVEDGAVVVGAPNVNIATTDFTARGGQDGNGGDNYPFRKPTVEPVGVGYQQSLQHYLTATAADGGLEGTITAARYPVGGDGRLQPTP